MNSSAAPGGDVGHTADFTVPKVFYCIIILKLFTISVFLPLYTTLLPFILSLVRTMKRFSPAFAFQSPTQHKPAQVYYPPPFTVIPLRTQAMGRIFSVQPADVDPSTISHYFAPTHLTHLNASPNCPPSILVYVAGEHTGNLDPAMSGRGTCGIYFGPDSMYNVGTILWKGCRETREYAELLAVQRALTIVENLLAAFNGGPLSRGFQAVIVTDSAYAVGCLAYRLEYWKRNGFKDDKGLPVPNKERILAMDGQIERLRVHYGITVVFWQVWSMYNAKALCLARLAIGKPV